MQMIEWYSSTPDLLCSGACLAMMVTSAVCAAFRWFHMCSPYDENPEHFYPARKLVTTFFLCQLLNAPFLLRPSLEASVCYAASVELLLCSVFITLIFNKFFRRRVPHKRIAVSVFVLVPLALVSMSGVGLAIMPSAFAPLIMRWQTVGVGGFALLLGVNIFMVMLWIVRKIDRYHKAEFSCSDDFPYTFAQKLIWLPWLVLALCWLTMITCSAGLLVSLWLALAVFSVYYTIIIMKPQIASLPKEIGAEEDEVPGEDDADESLTDEAESVREAIRRRVIEIARSRYREPHLTRRDIVGMFEYGERTIAGEIITSYGFYDMINTLRLQHARLYQEQHPTKQKSPQPSTPASKTASPCATPSAESPSNTPKSSTDSVQTLLHSVLTPDCNSLVYRYIDARSHAATHVYPT